MSDQTATYELTQDFTRKDSDEELTVTVTSTDRDKDNLEQKAKEKAADTLGYDSPAALADDWRPRAIYLDWEDPPWDDEDDIKNALTGIESVTKYYTDIMHNSEIRAPAIYLHTEDPESVADAATDYYSGFTHQLEDNRVIVFPAPFTP